MPVFRGTDVTCSDLSDANACAAGLGPHGTRRAPLSPARLRTAPQLITGLCFKTSMALLHGLARSSLLALALR